MPGPLAFSMLDPPAYLCSLCHTPWHTYRTYASPAGIPMESMPDPPAYLMPNRLAFKDPKGKAMSNPLLYLWNLCRTPWHTYGSYAAPLGITMEPMPHPLAFPMPDAWHSNKSNARPCGIQTKLMQTIWHTTTL